jgi:Eukaryotic cytochrome b561
MIDWLLSPLSGAAQHHISPWAMWHARCMVLGWGVLLPLGALVARFYKVLPRQAWPQQLDNKAWWHAHRGLQWAGIAAMSLGAVLAWQQASASTPAALWHGWAGWALVVAGWLQVAGGLARGSKGGPGNASPRGDHYDMTPYRLAFERLHKGLGWLAVLAAIGVIAMGLWLVDAPRWMATALALWWMALVAAFTQLQRAGRCIDTYQAIWGPGPQHPGNRRAPIGWGVRRPLG